MTSTRSSKLILMKGNLVKLVVRTGVKAGQANFAPSLDCGVTRVVPEKGNSGVLHR